MRYLFLYILFCTAWIANATSQHNTDSVLVLQQLTLSEQYHITNLDSSFYYADKALDLATKTQFTFGKIKATNRMGEIYAQKHDFSLAITYFEEAIKISLEENVITFLPLLYQNLVIVYKELNQLLKALQYRKLAFQWQDSVNNIDAKILQIRDSAALETAKEKQAIAKLQSVNLQEERKKENKTLIILILVGVISILTFMLIYTKRKTKLMGILKAQEEKTLNITLKQNILADKELSIFRIAQAQTAIRTKVSFLLQNNINIPLEALYQTLKNNPTCKDKRLTTELDKICSAQDFAKNLSNQVANHNIFENNWATFCENQLKWALENTNIVLSFSCDEDLNKDLTINTPLQENVYRILQELCNNIIKHANASLAEVNLQKTDQTILIRVKDNGIGFSKKPTHGIGLNNIRTRIQAYKGKIDIQSEPKQGTTIDIELKI